MRSRKAGGILILVGLTLVMAITDCRVAYALIRGGEGNSPLTVPGWPTGAAAIFNHASRIAWWEGPPYGGGQYHAECRGDAKALNAVFADFAKLDVKNKRIFVHNGVGHSFWLNPNREPAKQAAAQIDWLFMVWVPGNWQHLRKLPVEVNPTNLSDADKGAPSQIHIYTGGNVRWSDVTIPEGLEVVDQRLEAHGFTLADGTVLEGTVLDLATQQPLAARIELQRTESQPDGGYRYVAVTHVMADQQGRWQLKKAPEGSLRVVAMAEGYVPRVLSYAQFDGQPCWQSYSSGLARAVSVAGQITDEEQKPLAGVTVRLSGVLSKADRYEPASEFTTKTDADGRFRMDQVPEGSGTVWIHKSGYCRPGLGQPISMPKNDIHLSMIRSARIHVTVDFTGLERPGGYIVRMEPEGGAATGKWSASGNIDANNQIVYQDIPPGRYVVVGHPNPSSADQRTKPQTVELKGGETLEMTLKATQ